METSQSSNLFGSDQDGFEDALMAIDLDTPSRSVPSHSVVGSPTSPGKTSLGKRKFSQTEEAIADEEADLNPRAMAVMRERDDKNDIYGASSFGNWGQYMARKRAKLQIQNEGMVTTKSRILEGVEIYINGRTEPSVQVLRELIVEHGGTFHAYLTRKSLVTHIIAMNLTPAKVKEYQNMRVVRPEWIMESVKAGSLLHWRDFKLEMETRLDVGQGKRIPQAKLPITQLNRSHPRSQAQPNEVTRPEEAKGSKIVSVDVELTREKAEGSDDLPLGKSPDHGISDPIYMTDPVTLEQAARIPSYALNKSNFAAQRLMAQPGWKEENTAASGTKFINSYYQHSRLHHLSMWKAELKDLVAKAQERFENEQEETQTSETAEDTYSATVPQIGHGVSMKGAELLKTWETASPDRKGKGTAVNVVQRIYMHCDFDCFFVSVGLLDRPNLRGKPVVVCHSQGSGEGAASTSEIASSSYEARAAGIRNGMSLGQARQLCAEVITLPYEFEKYKEISLKFYTVLLSYADELQAVSVDEALLDVSHAVANLKVQMLSQNPENVSRDFSKLLAKQIRERMLVITGCQVSIGIGENLLLARIASRRAKPANSFHLLTADAPDFLAPLPLDMIWGVGYSNKKKAQEKLDIENIGDLAKHPKGALVRVFGPAMGDKLYKAARGLDESKLQPDQKRKSVSAEINFGIRFQNNVEAEQFTRKLGKEVSNRLQAVSLKGRHLTLKTMKRHPEAPVEASKFMGHGICETFSRSMSIGEPESGGRGRQESATSNADILGDAAWKLLRDLNFDPKELRGLGLQITKLESSGEESSTTADQAMESGQTRLAFKSEAKVTSKSFTGVPSSSNDYHPTEETLDFEALEALPEDIRAEVMAQLKTNGVVPGPSVSHTTNPLIDATEERPFLKAGLGTTTMSLNDQTAEGFAIGTLATPIVIDEDIGVPISMKPASTRAPSKNVAHITRQLRPKAKAVVTTPIKDGAPTSHSIFSKRRWGVIVTEEEIKELGFDPDVFYALPADLQREQLRLERENQKPARENVISSKKIAFGDAFTRVSRSPAPRSGFKLEAKFPEKVPLKVTHTRSGGSDDAEPSAKVKLVELGDIQAYVKRWTSTSHATGLAPSKAGIEGLKEWLVKYMGQEGSGTGMERVVVVLRWWRELLRKFWSEQEKLSADSAARAGVGAEWWSAFGECKDAVDRISKQRFGGKISLR